MPAPEGDLLHEWLRQTAARSPDAIALIEEDRSLTFAELHAQAQSLALRFAACGIQPRDRIALALPKNIEAIVAVFAALMAGAIYVPLHPRWPRERIETVVKECGARLLIEMEDSALRITDLPNGILTAWPIGGDSLAATTTGAARAFLPSMTAEDTAFLLFTSGSTGRPKGVELSHRAVSVFVRWTAVQFRINAADRLACPSPLGFDLSTFDIFNMALCGATAVLIPDNIAWMPRFLVQFVREAGITCWYSVPSILTGMVRDGRMAARDLPRLRLILFAGEVFPAPVLAALLTAVPDAECANLYGPTETNVVTWSAVPKDFDGSSPLPIGRPCPYAHVTLDAGSGELLAGGQSLMRGYWNQPDETARSMTTLDGVPYYRTGDRVAISASGEYLFLGRLDRQVKRRGFRIELDELEAALVLHPLILEAAVVAAAEAEGTVLIVAFVHPGAALTVADVKTHGARHLPHYMLPDRIVFTDAIAKNARGKTDYLALSKIAEGWKSGD